nr:MAG TPA: hypothetical protein [Caudoviricetes sp.]
MHHHQFPLPKSCLQKVLSRLVQLSDQSFTI